MRGLHYQVAPSQGKLVGVLRGRIWDVVVDIRAGSGTFGKHFGIELSDTNGCLLWVPPGFAHGFMVIGDVPADVLYKVDQPYNPAGEGGILWSDPDLGIHWPEDSGLKAIVNAKDLLLPCFKEYRANPKSRRLPRMPTLSIIVPVYNEARQLEEVVRMLFKTAYPCEREWIFVDDCSKDKSLEILKRFAKNFR